MQPRKPRDECACRFSLVCMLTHEQHKLGKSMCSDSQKACCRCIYYLFVRLPAFLMLSKPVPCIDARAMLEPSYEQHLVVQVAVANRIQERTVYVGLLVVCVCEKRQSISLINSQEKVSRNKNPDLTPKIVKATGRRIISFRGPLLLINSSGGGLAWWWRWWRQTIRLGKPSIIKNRLDHFLPLQMHHRLDLATTTAMI